MPGGTESAASGFQGKEWQGTNSAKGTCQSNKFDFCSSNVNKRGSRMLWGRNEEGKLPASLFCFLILFTPFLQGQNWSIALWNTLADSQILDGSFRHRGWRDVGGPISIPEECLSALFYFSQEFGYFSLHRASGLPFCCLGRLPKVPFMHACLVKKFMVQLGRQQGQCHLLYCLGRKQHPQQLLNKCLLKRSHAGLMFFAATRLDLHILSSKWVKNTLGRVFLQEGWVLQTQHCVVPYMPST